MLRLESRATGALVLSALVSLAACGGDESAESDGSGGGTPAEAPAEVDVEAAIAVYESAACWTCHGRPYRDEGGLAGPALTGLGEHWTAPDLADFIDDPEAWVANDGRLKALKTQFPLPMMPTLRPVSLEDRLVLARWLLTLE